MRVDRQRQQRSRHDQQQSERRADRHRRPERRRGLPGHYPRNRHARCQRGLLRWSGIYHHFFEGHASATVQVDSRINGWYVGNIVFGGLSAALTASAPSASCWFEARGRALKRRVPSARPVGARHHRHDRMGPSCLSAHQHASCSGTGPVTQRYLHGDHRPAAKLGFGSWTGIPRSIHHPSPNSSSRQRLREREPAPSPSPSVL